MSSMHSPVNLEKSRPTAEDNGKDKLEKGQDTASETSSRSSGKLADENQTADVSAKQKDRQSSATADPLHKEVNNSDVSEKELEKDTLKSSASIKDTESDEGLSEAVDQNEVVTELLPHEKQEMEIELNETPNGFTPSNVPEISLELSETNESSTPLIQNPKPSKTLWKNVRDSFTKSSEALHPPVHTEAQLSSADFNVAVVTYKRTTSRDYSKVDIHYHDDDEDQSALYSDISTSWATSFWTQFTVLLQRTFKQSKPEILSKLNFTQVCNNCLKFILLIIEDSLQISYDTKCI